MRKTLFFKLSLFFILPAFLQPGFAQEYTRWKLPEGAKLRLGKGSITGNIAYSPDGKILAAASGIGVWLYDAYTGAEVNLLAGHTIPVQSLEFSPDGSTLASGGANLDNTIRLWDVHTGAHRHTLTGHEGGVRALAFSPDSLRLASGSEDDSIRLWDTRTYQSVQVLDYYTRDVRSIVFSPDGATLASGSGDDIIRLRNAQTGEIVQTLEGHIGSVWSVAFSPDGNTLAGGGWNNTIRLWDVGTGENLQVLEGHFLDITTLTFSSDGLTLASASSGEYKMYHTIRLWNARSGELLHVFEGHDRGINSAAFSPDGFTIAGGNGYGIQTWDVRTGNSLQTFGEEHSPPILCAAFSPDGLMLVSGSWDYKIRLRDARTGEHLQTLVGHSSEVNSIAFSPDGSTLASGGGYQDNSIRIWDSHTGEHLQTLEGHTDQVNSVAFSPDGSTLASGGGYSREAEFDDTDNTIRFWNADTWELLQAIEAHRSGISSVAFSPNGLKFASASWDGRIRLRDARTFKHFLTYHVHSKEFSDHGPTSVAFSPNGSLLASGARWSDRTVSLWGSSGGEALNPLHGHTAYVTSVVFSPEGQTLASGSLDGTILLWKGMLYTTWGTIKRTDVAGDTIQSKELSPLITRLTSTETALLPNYPNPFNPETWIPYQLRKSAEVVLTIYDMKGQAVRTLELGHQPAGAYRSRERAAYWDGRNQQGEAVANGVYFCTLSAGDFTAGQKMLVGK